MHILQSEHTRLKDSEAEKLLSELNVSKAQLPKIFLNDPAVPDNCNIGDIIKIKRKDGEIIHLYHRVVV